MDKEIEISKCKLELQKVQCARAEQEHNILIRQSEIKRLQETVKIQLDKETEIQQRIQALIEG